MDTGHAGVAAVSTPNGTFRLEKAVMDGHTHYVLFVNECLMTRTDHLAGTRLAELVLAGIPAEQRHAEVLLGGLGLGMTLRKVLDHPAVQSVCVVEIEPRIVEWNRKYLNNADLLDDGRVELVMGDFCAYVEGVPRNYNGIAIHIDAGPERVARVSNRRVYSLSMLRILHARLRSGGALAIQTGQQAPSYERALRGIFEHVEVHKAVGGLQDTIYQVKH